MPLENKLMASEKQIAGLELELELAKGNLVA